MKYIPSLTFTTHSTQAKRLQRRIYPQTWITGRYPRADIAAGKVPAASAIANDFGLFDLYVQEHWVFHYALTRAYFAASQAIARKLRP